MKASAEDLKQVDQLIALLRRSSFKDMTGPECLTVSLTFHWVGELRKRIELDVKAPVALPNPVSTSAKPDSVVKLDPSKKKKK